MREVPAWHPDEAALSGVGSLAQDEVGAYAERQAFDPSRELRLLTDLGLAAGETLVEFGPGPGGLALAAAEVAGTVIAVDPAPVMTARIEQEAARRGLVNLRVVRAGFLSYEHEGAPAGFVFSKNALHQLPDFWKVEALRRVAAIMRPGGIFRLRDLVWSFPPEEAGEWLERWFADAEALDGGWPRADLEAHVREEFSTYTWLLEPMLERAGFAIEERTCAESGVFAAYTCRRR